MPRHEPLPTWDGEDVYVVGGGPSLRGFDWSQLSDRKVIGCNQAFLLGGGIVDLCVFGDLPFWNNFWFEIERSYGGWVATNCWIQPAPPWLHVFDRIEEGLGGRHHKALAWNANTGALATNLALWLGAHRVFLLGFDLKAGSDAKTHWHDAALEDQTAQHYRQFADGFSTVRRQYPDVYPGTHVYNVHDDTSDLKCFPSMSFEMLGMLGPPRTKEGT